MECCIWHSIFCHSDLSSFWKLGLQLQNTYIFPFIKATMEEGRHKRQLWFSKPYTQDIWICGPATQEAEWNRSRSQGMTVQKRKDVKRNSHFRCLREATWTLGIEKSFIKISYVQNPNTKSSKYLDFTCYTLSSSKWNIYWACFTSWILC